MDAVMDEPDAAVIPWDTLHSSIWRAVLQELPPKQRCQAALVCTTWHRHALSLCSQHLQLTLQSGRSCGALGLWLRRHGHTLLSLDISDTFYRHQRVPMASRIRPVDRLALLQGLHGNGRPLAALRSLRLCLDELSAADASVLGLCSCPALTLLQLDSNGSNIGVTGAQGLAPLSQLQQLIVPTQSLGDEGLRIISCSMPRLAHINLHNDGHVTDDGLPALAALSCLTSLDLQGSISITNRGMAALAEEVPQLQELNISWCAGVEDYGLGRLCSLTGLTALNLAATGIHFADEAVLQALSQLARLARLRLDRCAVGRVQLQALAKALPGLQDLNLSYNAAMTTFGDLRALSKLSQLTRLDVSHPQELQHPDADLAAVFELTQLHSLNASYVLPLSPDLRSYYSILPQMVKKGAVGGVAPAGSSAAGGEGGARLAATAASTTAEAPSAAAISTADPAADPAAADPGTAAAPTAAAASPPAVPDVAAASTSRGGQACGFWQQLHLNLSLMQHLTELNFQGNLSSPWYESGWEEVPPPPPQAAAVGFAQRAAAASAASLQRVPRPQGLCQAAVFLHALASVQPQSPLLLLRLSLPKPQSAPLHDAEVDARVHAHLVQRVAGTLAAFIVAGGLGSAGITNHFTEAPAAAPAAGAAPSAPAAARDPPSSSSSDVRLYAPWEALQPLVRAFDGQLAQHAWWQKKLQAVANAELVAKLSVQPEAELTPSEAAAVIKQMLPALQLLQLTTRPYEHDSSGMGLVTWHGPEFEG